MNKMIKFAAAVIALASTSAAADEALRIKTYNLVCVMNGDFAKFATMSKNSGLTLKQAQDRVKKVLIATDTKISKSTQSHIDNAMAVTKHVYLSSNTSPERAKVTYEGVCRATLGI